MSYSVVYDKANGKLVSVTYASVSSGLTPDDIIGKGTFALVAKLPKKAAAWGTLEIRKGCRVKDILSNGTVELELAKV